MPLPLLVGQTTSGSPEEMFVECAGIVVPAGAFALVSLNQVWPGTAALPPPPHTIAVTFNGAAIPALFAEGLVGIPDPSAPAEDLRAFYILGPASGTVRAEWTISAPVKNLLVHIIAGHGLPETDAPQTSSGGVTDEVVMEMPRSTNLPGLAFAWHHECGPVNDDTPGTWDAPMLEGVRVGTNEYGDENDATLSVAYRVAQLTTDDPITVRKSGFTARACVACAAVFPPAALPIFAPARYRLEARSREWVADLTAIEAREIRDMAVRMGAALADPDTESVGFGRVNPDDVPADSSFAEMRAEAP